MLKDFLEASDIINGNLLLIFWRTSLLSAGIDNAAWLLFAVIAILTRRCTVGVSMAALEEQDTGGARLLLCMQHRISTKLMGLLSS